jgi:hypothetical protein
MPRQAASIVRGSVLRSRVFSLAKTCSIGLRSASSAAGRTAWRRRGGSGGARSWLARDRPGWTVATIVSSVSMPAACRFVRSRGISWSFMALRFRHRSILSRVGASDKPGAVDHSIYKGHLKTLDDEDLRRWRRASPNLRGSPNTGRWRRWPNSGPFSLCGRRCPSSGERQHLSRQSQTTDLRCDAMAPPCARARR